MQLSDFTESEFRSVLLATLHSLAEASQMGAVQLAVMDIEHYLEVIQDDEEPKLWEDFYNFSQDEVLRNYFATR